MHQQLWVDLWHQFLAVMSAETIEMRIVIGIAIAFFAVMSLTGIVDSFLPSRAARRYAAMYDLTPAIQAAPATTGFVAVPPMPEQASPDDAPQDETTQEIAEETGGNDLRLADMGVNPAANRRSQPTPPKVFRAQKP